MSFELRFPQYARNFINFWTPVVCHTHRMLGYSCTPQIYLEIPVVRYNFEYNSRCTPQLPIGVQLYVTIWTWLPVVRHGFNLISDARHKCDFDSSRTPQIHLGFELCATNLIISFVSHLCASYRFQHLLSRKHWFWFKLEATIFSRISVVRHNFHLYSSNCCTPHILFGFQLCNIHFIWVSVVHHTFD